MAVHSDNYWLEQIATGGGSSPSDPLFVQVTSPVTVEAPEGGLPTQGGAEAGDPAGDTNPYLVAAEDPDGNISPLQNDEDGYLETREQYAPGYEDNVANRALVEQRNNYTHISTATTTVVKTGAGHLHRLVVQGGTAGTIVVYDNTAASGSIIASFDSTNDLASYEFNCSFATGLTIVTGAAVKVTAVWR